MLDTRKLFSVSFFLNSKMGFIFIYSKISRPYHSDVAISELSFFLCLVNLHKMIESVSSM